MPEETSTSASHWQVGDWRLDPLSGDLDGPSGSARLEPKLLELLRVLVEADGAVVSQEQLLERLWPGMIVGEDTVARSVSRLRRALGDSAREPRYVETLSKRGYRLVAPVRRVEPPAGQRGDSDAPAHGARGGQPRRWPWALGAAALLVAVLALWTWQERGPTQPAAAPGPEAELLARADDHYAQYQFQDNEAALQLYERVLALRPDHPPALAGLANALVQKAMRWPEGGGQGPEFRSLGDALAAGHLRQPANARLVARARGLAEQALQTDPASIAALRAFGLAASAQSDFGPALEAYRRAIAIDPEAWGVLINLADVLEITGRPDEALPHFEAAYAAMERAYAEQPARIRGWDAALGVLIGDRHRERGDAPLAEAWYRRVLRTSPLHPGATRALAGLLRSQGDAEGAERLCRALEAQGERCEP